MAWDRFNPEIITSGGLDIRGHLKAAGFCGYSAMLPKICWRLKTMNLKRSSIPSVPTYRVWGPDAEQVQNFLDDEFNQIVDGLWLVVESWIGGQDDSASL
jgi:hypothetical protein